MRTAERLRLSPRNGQRPHGARWGPAFFTKLLYFAHTGPTPGSALILDNLTAAAVAEISGLPHFVRQATIAHRARTQLEKCTTTYGGI